MADDTTAVGTPPPAVPAQVPPAAPAVAIAPPAAPPAPGEPEWLNDRIAQSKRSEREAVLRELGVTDVGAAKTALDAAKKAADAQKTDAQRAADLETQLTTANATIESQRAVLVQRAAVELATLTAEQQDIIKDLAGDDADAQLLAIGRLRPSWTTAAPAAAPGAKPVAPPASTTAAPAAPLANAAPPEPLNHAAVYDELKIRNPMAASAFYSAYAPQIAAARKPAA